MARMSLLFHTITRMLALAELMPVWEFLTSIGGPAYAEVIKSAADGSFKPFFTWNAPDWKDMTAPVHQRVGYVNGTAITAENAAVVDKFIAELAGGLNLWKGPLNLQDGTSFLAEGVTATDYQVWYLPQLLEGMVGLSTPAN